jgi:hypothetical protein
LYDGTESARLPRVKLDGKQLPAEALTYSSGNLAFNKEIRGKQKIYHLAMQWHVFSLLYARSFLPAQLIRDVYLPVGNPETQWLYGLVRAGFALRVRVADGAMIRDHLIFVTTYNRASLPVPTGCSFQLSAPEETLATCSEDGFFAMRIVRKDGATTAPEAAAEVSIRLVRSVGPNLSGLESAV